MNVKSKHVLTRGKKNIASVELCVNKSIHFEKKNPERERERKRERQTDSQREREEAVGKLPAKAMLTVRKRILPTDERKRDRQTDSQRERRR